MIPGYATPAGTAAYASRFRAHFYRKFDGLTLSTLGLGTYLGNPDDATDRAYEGAVEAAVRGGVNLSGDLALPGPALDVTDQTTARRNRWTSRLIRS